MVFVCINCLHKWNRKEDYSNHFSLKEVRRSNKRFTNPCFNKAVGDPASSVTEARMIKDMRAAGSGMFKRPLPPNEADDAQQRRQSPPDPGRERASDDHDSQTSSISSSQNLPEIQEELESSQSRMNSDHECPVGSTQESQHLVPEDIDLSQDLFVTQDRYEDASTATDNCSESTQADEMFVTQDLFMDCSVNTGADEEHMAQSDLFQDGTSSTRTGAL